jgi:hypothetical protein
MSHEPPIPQAARSPYPLQPPPIAGHESAEAGPEASAEGQGEAAAQSASPETADQSWAGRARDTFDRASESKVALGAAVGIGSAALLAALLFTRRGRKQRA